MKLILLSRDLMLAARVEGATRQCGLTMVAVPDLRGAIELVDDSAHRLLVVDLRASDLDINKLVSEARCATARLPVIACGPHVHEKQLAAAREAGCDAVVTRGQLDRDAESIFQKMLLQND